MRLSSDLLEFIRLLNEKEVEYLLVGGWAFALHSRPRYTKDIDILVHREPSNAKRMMEVIRAFGFGGLDLSEKDFLKPHYIIQLGVEPNRIDILTDISGIDFEEEWERRLLVKYEGLELKVISREGLIRNKLAAGRQQDFLDAKSLQKPPKAHR